LIGKEFWPGAVTALAPEGMRDQVWPSLQALIRKELVRPGGSPFAGEDPFSFSHILIRDTAYDAMLKRIRAELHELFAAWLEEKASDRLGEYEEILAYHLEQAHEYRRALGNAESEARALAMRAAGYLADAGSRAHGRGDMQAAVKLLERSFSLDPAKELERLPLRLELGHALFEIGELRKAEALFSNIAEQAAKVGDRGVELRARLAYADLKAYTNPETGLQELRELSEQAIPVLDELGDDAALAKCWRGLATVDFFACRFGSGARSLERALAHAERSSDRQLVAEVLPGLGLALCLGPLAVDEAVARVEQLLERFDPGDGEGEPAALGSLGTRAAVEAWGLAGLEAMRGRFSVARALCAGAKSIFREVGQQRRLNEASIFAGMVERLAGRLADAEAEFRIAYDVLRGTGEKGLLSTVASELAEVVHLQGRAEEAERLSEESEELAIEDDVESQARWRTMRAKLCAARGELETAERLARDAVRRAAGTEFPNLRAAASISLAEVLVAAGRDADAAEAAAEALRFYKEKGNEVSAVEAEALLARVSDASA
jgi:tetratricopeptide (TPR) repeat protein